MPVTASCTSNTQSSDAMRSLRACNSWLSARLSTWVSLRFTGGRWLLGNWSEEEAPLTSDLLRLTTSTLVSSPVFWEVPSTEF